ncbi:hypothetical protein CR513_25803, partial [Mucuna pruriens]
MKYDAQSVCNKCITCKQAKSKVMPHSFYTPLSVPNQPWTGFLDLNVENTVYLFKMTYFIAYSKTNDATHVVDLFFKEVVHLHGLPRTIKTCYLVVAIILRLFIFHQCNLHPVHLYTHPHKVQDGLEWAEKQSAKGDRNRLGHWESLLASVSPVPTYLGFRRVKVYGFWPIWFQPSVVEYRKVVGWYWVGPNSDEFDLDKRPRMTGIKGLSLPG